MSFSAPGRNRSGLGVASNPDSTDAISVFIVFNLFAILCWAFPLDTQLFLAVNHHTYYYMNFFGLSQGWSPVCAESPEQQLPHVG